MSPLGRPCLATCSRPRTNHRSEWRPKKPKTETITVIIPTDTAKKLRAYQDATNGSIHNQVAAVIEAGITARVAVAPEVFRERYEKNLRIQRAI